MKILFLDDFVSNSKPLAKYVFSYDIKNIKFLATLDIAVSKIKLQNNTE